MDGVPLGQDRRRRTLSYCPRGASPNLFTVQRHEKSKPRAGRQEERLRGQLPSGCPLTRHPPHPHPLCAPTPPLVHVRTFSVPHFHTRVLPWGRLSPRRHRATSRDLPGCHGRECSRHPGMLWNPTMLDTAVQHTPAVPQCPQGPG